MFFYFLLELKIVCQLITWCPRVSCLPNSVDHKEDPHCYRNYCEDKRPRDWEWSDYFRNFELGKLFLQAFCKVASFPLVLDLIRECYVISFPDVFHFLILSSCFVAYFHISTSQKLRGNDTETDIPLERVKITRNWNFHPQTKHTFILC